VCSLDRKILPCSLSQPTSKPTLYLLITCTAVQWLKYKHANCSIYGTIDYGDIRLFYSPAFGHPRMLEGRGWSTTVLVVTFGVCEQLRYQSYPRRGQYSERKLFSPVVIVSKVGFSASINERAKEKQSTPYTIAASGMSSDVMVEKY